MISDLVFVYTFLIIVKEEISSLQDGMNKADNSNRVRKVLENTELSDESI
jgi:hypothetical protein